MWKLRRRKKAFWEQQCVRAAKENYGQVERSVIIQKMRNHSKVSEILNHFSGIKIILHFHLKNNIRHCYFATLCILGLSIWGCLPFPLLEVKEHDYSQIFFYYYLLDCNKSHNNKSSLLFDIPLRPIWITRNKANILFYLSTGRKENELKKRRETLMLLFFLIRAKIIWLEGMGRTE